MAHLSTKLDVALGLIAQGKFAQARLTLMRLVQAVPADPAPLDAMRALCSAEGDINRAHYFAQRTLSLAPGHAGFMANLAGLECALGDFPAAVARAQSAIAIDAQRPQAHAALIGALLSLGHYADALAAAELATTVFPGDGDFAVKHAAALLHLGLADLAMPILARVQLAEEQHQAGCKF